ncbi:MAG: phosphoribosylglycinamide formyltransferase [Gammaproteobacteria bacterium]|nr:phosphoribosylglycinamide formyltransferase [Gammaproteobacteria bacterium]
MNTVILISGNGSNLQAIINATKSNATKSNATKRNAIKYNATQDIIATNDNAKDQSTIKPKKNLPINIAAVISSKPEAYGLECAKLANIHTEVLDHRQFENRHAYDAALQKLIDQFNPQLVVLAGFMRILTDEFVKYYLGRLINIHPSLLPQFPGLNTHQQALNAGVKTHGASAHFVIPELDAGPVIIQTQVPVNENDTTESLRARVLEQEHIIYPLAIRWFADNRLILKDNVAYLDDCPLAQPK